MNRNRRELFAVASVKAFIEKDGKILILRESFKYKAGSNHGQFVLPGGKVDEGEHFAKSLRREVKEECGLQIRIGEPFHVDEWQITCPAVDGFFKAGEHLGIKFLANFYMLNSTL
jgi:8-oxo-dGTP pyrophosphatase MutT (NUDIX family)